MQPLFGFYVKALLLFLSFGIFTTVQAKEVSTTTPAVEAAVSTEKVSSTTATSTLPSPQIVETRVRQYFADIPVMIEIAKCESGFRQFTDAGNLFRGGAGGGMLGIFQFYEAIHAKPALALGFDLATVDGNLGYARHLYLQSGTTPWQVCVPMTPVLDANTQKRIEIIKQLIVLLQQLLALQLAEG